MKRGVLIGFGALAAVLILLLVVTPAAFQGSHAPLLSQVKSQVQWGWAQLRYQYYLRQLAADQSAFQNAVGTGRAVLITIPYPSEQAAARIKVEQAIQSFAVSNRVALIHLQSAGTSSAQVYVWAKDAPAMKGFVKSLGGNQ